METETVMESTPGTECLFASTTRNLGLISSEEFVYYRLTLSMDTEPYQDYIGVEECL